jgi:hypothetical protein
VADGMRDIDIVDFASLVAGDRRVWERLEKGARVSAVTPFRYPGRRGWVVLHITPVVSEAGGPRRVLITDGGALIRSLDEQGLDLTVDMVVSKTLFHAVKEVEGAFVNSGEVCLASTAETLASDLWRLLQLIAELGGLRHAKYKDALVQLSRRGERAPDLINW